MLKDNTIRKKVMTVINTRIDSAQKSYEEGCQDLDEKLLEDKSALADRKVKEIIGNL